jgi:UDP-N-acetylglucosamine 4,6-dehydratase
MPVARHFPFPSDLLNDRVVLVTGGTGSFGQAFVRYCCEQFRPRKLIVFSRDELKQFEMSQVWSDRTYDFLRYFVGDVRDRDRLHRAFHGVDLVVHAAALKQVPTAEYNPSEAIKTNVDGAMNVIDAAIDAGVRRVVGLSTDKACNPINLYGASKLCAEKLFIAGNAYAGGRATRLAVVRYGNVVGSRGSIVPFFRRMKATGALPITDPRMTRYWITLEQGVEIVLSALHQLEGGEIFVPKIPSMRITDLARVIAPECRLDTIGIRPGEKLHEMLVSEEEARNATETDRTYVIRPQIQFGPAPSGPRPGERKVPDGFRYSSDTNAQWLSDDEMRRMISALAPEGGPAHG